MHEKNTIDIHWLIPEDKKLLAADSYTKDWIIDCIENHKKQCGTINYIFCDDDYLLEINKEYLQHDYFTDVISFSYVDDNVISGDIFISIDRISENAISHQVNRRQELLRVMIHGVLHFLGYDDATATDKEKMRAKEDHYLSLLKDKNAQ